MSLPTSQLLHYKGRCQFDFTDDNKLVSCGSEGTVRLVSLNPFEDNGFCLLELQDHSQLLGVAMHPTVANQVVLAKDESGLSGSVDLYEITNNQQTLEYKTRLLNMSMSVHDICTAGEDWVAVTSLFDPLQVLRLSDPIHTVQVLKNHTGAVIGLCGTKPGLHNAKLCTIAQDGSLTVWKLDVNQAWVVDFTKTNYCQRVTTEDSSIVYKPSFHPSIAGLLAVPGQRELGVLREGGKLDDGFELVDFPSVITHCCFSANRLVAASKQKLVIWNLHTKRVESTYDLEYEPTCLQAQSDNAVFLNDIEGNLVRFALPVMNMPSVSVVKPQVKDAAFDEEDSNSEVEITPPRARDDGDEEPTSLEAIKQQFESKLGFTAAAAAPSADVVQHLVQREIQLALERFELERKEREEFEREHQLANHFLQPNATKFNVDTEDPSRRFLCWNQVGSIFARKEESFHEEGEEEAVQSIEIEFAESARFRPIRFKDVQQFDRASMGETGALFSNTKGLLFFRSFNTDLYANWKLQLADAEERIVGLACGKEFSAVCTSFARLRIFRPSGLQDAIIQLESTQVRTMVANDTKLLVVYGKEMEDTVRYQLFDFASHTSQRVVCSGGLSCSAVQITWAGFADHSFAGMPVIMLRNGALLALSTTKSATWHSLTVVCDKVSSRKLWPISLSKTAGLLCVALRGDKRQPSVVPRSTPSFFAVKMPLLGAQTSKAENKTSYDFEQQSLIDLILLQEDREDENEQAKLVFDVMQLKAMLVAIRSQQLARAFGLVQRMLQTKTITLAIQKAIEAGAPSDFIDRMEELKSQREASEEEEEEERVAVEQDDEEDLRPKRLRYEQAEDDDYDAPVVQSPISIKPAVAPAHSNDKPTVRNKFLIGSSPALRESPIKTGSAQSPVQLSRQSTFTANAREEERRRL